MSFYISGRRIVYTNQVPYETDILATNDYNMAGVSGLAQTVIGLGIGDTTTVSGLACTPVSPPGLAVVVGVGAMYSFEDYDATDYGVIPADTDPNHKLYKQAFNWNPVTLNLTAPATPGNSVIYLIEGIFDTTDVNDVSRPYFNSADPTMPIFNNNYDTRTDIILFQAKQGTPGVTPTPPAPDAGYTGLYYVTVANGQTVITGGDISKVSTVEGQPFITEGLTQKVSSSTIATGYVSIPAQQAATYVSGVDVGSVNAIVCNPANNYAAPSLGMIISVLVANTNTGTATLKINGNSAINIQVATAVGLASLAGGEMVSGAWYDFRYNGTTWQLLNPTAPSYDYGIVSFNATSTQTITGGSHAIQFDNVVYDPNSWWDGSLYRWLPTVAGLYRFTACVFGLAVNSSQGINLYKNGAWLYRLGLLGNESGVSNCAPSGATPPIPLNGSTDSIQLIWENESASSTTIGAASGANGDKNFFSIEYIGN